MNDRTNWSRRRFVSGLGLAGAAWSAGTWSRAVGAETEPQRPLGVALLGLGSYSTYQLAPALQQTRHMRLTGVVTGTPAKGVAWRRRHGLPESAVYSYDTMSRLADDSNIDVVYVVTPTGLHAEHAIKAAQAGKHVICEKPMARDVAECDAIIEACRTAGVHLSIGYRLQFQPLHLELKRLAQPDAWGPFMNISGANGYRLRRRSWRVTQELAGGGPLTDMGVYVVQGACLAKRDEVPVAITAKFDPNTRPELFNEVEEGVRWTMTWSDGAVAEGHSSYATGASRLRASSDRGWAELNPAFSYGPLYGETSAGRMNFEQPNQQAVQMDAMALAIRAGVDSAAPGWMGRRDVAIIRAIYESAETGREVSMADYSVTG